MNWFVQLFIGSGVAQAVVALSLAIVLGLALGLIQFRGIRLGVGGVLFSGLLLAHMGMKVSHATLEFVREFGLILFVFSIGMQVGPGFVDSLRRRGLGLNLMAAFIVICGVAVTVGFFFLADLPLPVAVGLFSGAVTNTPSLAAAAQVFTEIAPHTANQAIGDAGLGYALAYPFGIFGIILVMLAVRAFFRIDTAEELHRMELEASNAHPPLQSMTLEVANPNLHGRTLRDVPGMSGLRVVIVRCKENAEESPVQAATPDIVIRPGMLLQVVGETRHLESLQVIIGPEKKEADLTRLPGPLGARRLLVTRHKVTGKSLRDLHLTPEHGVTVTRVMRAGAEFSARSSVHLHFGDKLICVGTAKDLDRAEALLGNSARELDHPQVLPIFLGILLGTILGSFPLAIPGLPSGVKLGLAGGPLLVAILLSRVHHFAGMTWYLPVGANLILREVGIALFLACVGLNAGDRFMGAVLNGSGLYWMGVGVCITLIPLILAAIVARAVLKWDYVTICGLLAGSMTDPPALAFASQMLGADAPTAVYASVYPLTMILRILAGQLLVLGLFLFT